MIELSTFSIILIIVLTLILIFFVLPALFNNLKKLWYLKHNGGYSNGFNVHQSMYYDAEKGKIEADQLPLH